jgi:ABC-type enterobactin transport system permease subunit
MSQKLYSFIHHNTTEIIGFFTGSSAGTLAYIQWQDKLITIGLAFVTGFIGAAGAHLYRKLTKQK